ncbi:TetR/AcrR family transcriptional regulator [Streptomyces sp. NPDC058683]|uniref:TetR/AcrR family transcriptional regulator n=1 Tax=Streptomyces sp. NPDC058683 TaxID=3346597 RepID=UPI003660BA08
MPTAKQRRGEETRQRLLDAALAAHEAGEATVQSVLASSGVSLGSPYHHFGSFDGLIAALFARCLGEMLDATVADLERARTARTGVTAAAKAYLSFTMDRPAEARVIHLPEYIAYRPAHAEVIAEAKRPRMARTSA